MAPPPTRPKPQPAAQQSPQQPQLSVMSIVLDQNEDLLLAIAECQRLGRTQRAVKYQRQLQENLLVLTQLCDSQEYYPKPFRELANKRLPRTGGSTSAAGGSSSNNSNSKATPAATPAAAGAAGSGASGVNGGRKGLAAASAGAAGWAAQGGAAGGSQQGQAQEPQQPQQPQQGQQNGARPAEQQPGMAAVQPRAAAAVAGGAAIAPGVAAGAGSGAGGASGRSVDGTAATLTSLQQQQQQLLMWQQNLLLQQQQAALMPFGGAAQANNVIAQMAAMAAARQQNHDGALAMLQQRQQMHLQQQLQQLQIRQAVVQQQIQQQQQQPALPALPGTAAGGVGGAGGGALVQTPYGLMKVQMVGQGSQEAAALPVVGSMNINIDPTTLLGGGAPNPAASMMPMPAMPMPGLAPMGGLGAAQMQQLLRPVIPAEQMMAMAPAPNPLDPYRWTPLEERRFREALARHGEGDLPAIAEYVGTKSRAQVRTRLKQVLKEREKRQREALQAAAAQQALGAPLMPQQHQQQQEEEQQRRPPTPGLRPG